jgi:hypothetical protein
MTIADELLALRDKDDGKIYPRVVVDWARANPDSELHNHRFFNWNVEEAAYDRWVDQARKLIALYIVAETGERKTISLMIDRTNGGGYRDLDEVMTNAELRRRALMEAATELLRWCDRHQHFKEFRPVFRALDRVIEKENLSPEPAPLVSGDGGKEVGHGTVRPG